MLASWRLILSAFVAVAAGRAIIVFAGSALVARGTQRIPYAWQAVLSWGGLRGGLSMVLALSLPRGFPNRELLIATTFGVVLLSILIQGLTMAPVLRYLGVARPQMARTAYDRTRGELKASQAALTELDQMLRTGQADRAGLERLRSDYQARLESAQGELQELRGQYAELHAEDLRRARRHLLMVEKTQTIEALQQGLLSREAYERLLADIDERLFRLDEPDAG
jgi:CPA1 family monovalent cation:H+ antiporter